MFPADTLPAAYCEEQERAERVKRLAKQQQDAALLKAQPAAVSLPPHLPSASASLGQALSQRPTLSRPNSSGFLGNIFQNFVKAAAHSPPISQCSTPLPGQAKEVNCAEMERLIAEQKRDADICAMPSW